MNKEQRVRNKDLIDENYMVLIKYAGIVCTKTIIFK